MGTRNLTKVIDRNGEIKVAQYGQWDGYPSGQGLNALYHATAHAQIESKLGNCHFLTQDEMDKINASLSGDERPFGEIYPTLSRDTCADILGYVAWSVGEVLLVDNREFENDDLFCEGVYTIDFQKGKFISTYGGKTLEFDLDQLPTPDGYLELWRE
jgi:hypothetical protein